MKKLKLSLFLLLLILGFFVSKEILASPVPERYRASSAKSVVETEIEEGTGQVYQYVETTVDGETVKKESFEPGKLELEMKKVGEGEPTVTFSQEEVSEKSSQSLITRIINFLKKLFSRRVNRTLFWFTR